MKTILCASAAIIFSTFIMNAQENMDKKKETVTQKVTVNDKKADAITVEETEEENSTLVVDGTDEVNQNTKVVTKTQNNSDIIFDEIIEIDDVDEPTNVNNNKKEKEPQRTL